MLHPFPHQLDSEEPIVELQNVTCGYEGLPVLKDINLNVTSGAFVGLLGPSGSGKTTLLRTILGAVDVYQGQVIVEGTPVTKQRPRAGYVPQLETIDWNFPVTVEEVVMMGRTMDNMLFPWYRREDRKLAREMMEKLGIVHLARRHIRELSGGQQQRAFLARALVSSPRLLLLDEPTASVDIKTRDDIMHLLDELNHQGVTIILTTHEINAVAAHLPWVVCLNGHIIVEGPPARAFTPEVLELTYNAEMPVTQYQGMTLVAEKPHFFGRNGQHSRPADPAKVRGHQDA
jgi:zinc/manganese transport system ATP-binding protein/zinc transport system ATP-binding protein